MLISHLAEKPYAPCGLCVFCCGIMAIHWQNWIDRCCLSQLVMTHQGNGAMGSALARIRYITQVKSRPPTFAVFVSGGLSFPENASRFLARVLQKDFEFDGVPIRAQIRYRKRKQGTSQLKQRSGPAATTAHARHPARHARQRQKHLTQ